MTKTPITQQQRDNQLDALHVMWPSVRPKNVVAKLKTWRCGTQACFGGHVAQWPAFRAQGVYAESDVPMMYGSFANPAFVLFGDHFLFDLRDYHPADDGHESDTDHECVTRRLKWAIEHTEVDA